VQVSHGRVPWSSQIPSWPSCPGAVIVSLLGRDWMVLRPSMSASTAGAAERRGGSSHLRGFFDGRWPLLVTRARRPAVELLGPEVLLGTGRTANALPAWMRSVFTSAYT
jgi:hypothetical protein